MAEGLLRKIGDARPGKFTVSSAGVSTVDGMPASSDTVRVMSEFGVDVTAHRSRQLRPEMVRSADHVFVMEERQREWIVRALPDEAKKVQLITEYCAPEDFENHHMDVPDPIRMPEHFYRNVFSVIRGCVARIAKELE